MGNRAIDTFARVARLAMGRGFGTLLLLGSLPWAMAQRPSTHPTREMLEAYERDGTLAQRKNFMKAMENHRAKPELLARAQHRLQKSYLRMTGGSEEQIARMAPPPAWQGMPTTGTVKVFTLLIDFSDAPHVTSQSELDAKVFGSGSGGYPYESLKNYYLRSSYGLLTLSGSTLGWYRPTNPRSTVTQTTAGREALIREALDAFDGLGHDFSQYDNDLDGKIDYFAVIWTGPHTGWGSFWWGYQTGWTPWDTYRLDGKQLTTYSWQWERYDTSDASARFDPLVLIHETGHALGLPDYYDYDGTIGPDGGVGGLDMMDANWGDHNAFSKFLLDWLTPTIVTSSATSASLRPSTEYPEAVIMMPSAPTGAFGEYFLIEYRRRVLNDVEIPTDGLLVWHVDARLSGGDYVYDNSFTAHKLLRLMEADGLEEIEQYAWADTGDFYTNGGVFGPSTTPNSNRYDGTSTLMELWNIGITASSAVFNISTVDAGDTLAPTVSASVSGTSGVITLQAEAQDNTGVASVSFYVNNALVGNVTTAPFSMTLDSRAISNGQYTLFARAYDAAGNIGTSPTVTFPVMNLVGGDLIRNGGFELGSYAWSGSRNRIQAWGTAFSGLRSAWLGGHGRASSSSRKKKTTDTLYQVVSIPAVSTRATLTLALRIDSAETAPRNYDTLKIELLDAKRKKVIKRFATFSNQHKGGGYQVYAYDASAYRGRKVQIRLTATEDRILRTDFHVDEVSLTVQ